MKNNDNGNQQQFDPEKITAPGLVTKNNSAATSASAPNDNQQHTNKWMPRWTINWTAILAVGTVVLGCAAIWSDFLISGQLTEMRNAGEDTKRAIEATNRLANAAEASAGIARDTEIRQLRAYLDTHTTGPPKLVAGQQVTVGFIVRNSGRTPAYSITTIGAIELRPYPPSQPEFYPVLRPAQLREQIINPERSNPAGAHSNVAISQDQIDQIMDGSKVRLYVWGTTFFIDAFNIERHANFAILWAVALWNPSDLHCRIHNGAN